MNTLGFGISEIHAIVVRFHFLRNSVKRGLYAKLHNDINTYHRTFFCSTSFSMNKLGHVSPFKLKELLTEIDE